MYLSDAEQTLMENSRYLSTGGIDLFYMYWTAPEGATPEQAREDLIHVPPDEYDPPLAPGQFVPMKPFPWASNIAHSDYSDVCIVAGVGCLHKDSRIYDADRMEYIPLSYYIENEIHPVVLSKTPNGWIKMIGSIPFYAGRGELVRVSFASGNSILATREHKVLLRRGYTRIRDLQLGDRVAAPYKLPLTSPCETESAPPHSETTSDSQYCCYPSARQYGAQLPLDEDSAQDAAPLSGDATLSSHSTLHTDDHRALELQHTQSLLHHSRIRSTYRAEHPDLHARPYVCVTEHQSGLPQSQDQERLSSVYNSIQYWKDVLASECISPVPTFSSYDASGRIVWKYLPYAYKKIDLHTSHREPLRQRPMYHTHQRQLEAHPEYSASSSKTSSESPCICNDNTLEYTCYDEVVNIESYGEDNYYDIHVPFYNNYVAEGIVNHNSGKTLNMVMVGGYYACMLPNFRYLSVAPLGWQSEMSYRDFLQQVLDYQNQQRPRRILRWIDHVALRPYPTIHFVNGSTMEFKSVDKDARGILTWSGDMIVVDQAEDPAIDLQEVTQNLGSRLRGQVGGRPRLGKLVFMANSAYNPELWEMFDRYNSDPDSLAITMSSYDNPVLTKRSLRDMRKRFANKAEAQRMMYASRPLPKGKEFTAKTIGPAQSEALDSLMTEALHEKLDGFLVESARSAGTIKWVRPPEDNHVYIMVGDPGQGNPPYRNSSAVMVFDVTGIPKQPAELVAFDWVYGYGSYWPFVNRMNEWHDVYKPYIAAFDATGTQKSFDDLGILDEDKIWMPLNFTGLKAHMVLCAKVLLSHGTMQIPKSLYSVWNQLLMWHMPDKALQQDVACCVFMSAYVINQMLPRRVEEDQEPDEGLANLESSDRWGRNRIINNRRTRIRRER